MKERRGRVADLDTADKIVLAELSRATKTHLAVIDLALGGFGQQASMLNRALFEAMVNLLWTTIEPETALYRFEKHWRLCSLQRFEARKEAGLVEDGETHPVTAMELKELKALFGPYGHKSWTGHNLDQLLKKVERIHHLFPTQEYRESLWHYYRFVHRSNNWLLHGASVGMMERVTLHRDGLKAEFGPSETMLKEALASAAWCYANLAERWWVYFEVPEQDRLQAVLDELAPL